MCCSWNCSEAESRSYSRRSGSLPARNIQPFYIWQVSGFSVCWFWYGNFPQICRWTFSVFHTWRQGLGTDSENLSKATGIRFLADRLGVPVKATYAFGDSTNDLLMLQFAGNSIAMGDSDPLILPHCTYQTTNIEDNGIANALKHFRLI